MAELRRRGVPVFRNDDAEVQPDLDVRSLRPPTYKLSGLKSIIFLIFWGIVILFLSIYFNDRLPQNQYDHQTKLQINSLNVLANLYDLTSLGPRVTGSFANEVEAVEFLTKRIHEIRNESSSIHLVTYDHQIVSGEFYLKIFSNESVFIYKNVQNVLVKIGPQKTSNKSLLINCHFDSVPTSPGASDDGLNCAIMLEMFRVLAISKEQLPHNIIFLFNGAEENPLLGSHGFITKHPWAQEVQTFINLESCGAGGREVLFQAGPNNSWLIEAYGKAALYPSGQVVAEELFQSGLIPSDTDFRIFRDFGHIPGLDFAHCKNGYVYHTRLDNIGSISSPHSVIKHTGENLLALTKQLLNSKQFLNREKYEKGQQVYFDIFGLFFINYSNDIGTALNIALSLISITSIYLTIFNLNIGNVYGVLVKIVMASVSLLGCVVMAMLYSQMIGSLLDDIGFPMSWYHHTSLVIFIYVIPTVLGMILNTVIVNNFIMNKFTLHTRIRLLCLSVQLFWTFLLISSIFLNVRSSYLLLMAVLPTASLTMSTSGMKLTGSDIYQKVFITVSTFSSALFCYLGVTSLRLFIPITGRMGATKNPEIIIGSLATVLSVAIFSHITTIFIRAKKLWSSISILWMLHFLSFVVIMTPVGFPFSRETPQRIFLTHVDRFFFARNYSTEYMDSIIWVKNLERRGSRGFLPFIKDAQPFNDFCEEIGHCGLPWFTKVKETEGSRVIRTVPHNLGNDMKVEIVSSKLKKMNYRLEFRFSGAPRMNVIITPSENVTLVKWNMPSSIRPFENTITFVQGLHNSSQTIVLEAIKPSPDSFIKVEVYGLYLAIHPRNYPKQFDHIYINLPYWTHCTPVFAIYKSFVF